MRNLDEIMHSLERRFAERRQAALSNTAKATPPPAPVTRDLFNGRDLGARRRYLNNVPMRVTGLGQVTYRGQELRADDRDVWNQLMHRVAAQPLGEWLEFEPLAILKAMGWDTGPDGQARLQTCLERMQATSIRVGSQRLRRGVNVSLICKLEWREGRDGGPGRWRVWIEPELKSLFGQAQLTRLDFQRQQSLGPLARRLHRLYMEHANPYPRKLETLCQRFGAGSKPEAFRRDLEAALEELRDSGFLEAYRIDERGLVQVERRTMAS